MVIPYSEEYIKQKLQELKTIFVHLHVHSDYSNLRLLDSTNKIQDIIQYVSSLQQNGVAITDHESLSGHIEFIKAIQDLKKENKISQDFKGILGNEIYLVNETQMQTQLNNKEYVPFYHFLLLAKDVIGHKMLRQLSSRAWMRMFNHKNMERVPTFYSDFDDIVYEQGHLIGSTACLGGYFPKKVVEILNEQDEVLKEELKYEVDDFIQWCIGVFGKDNFYIELQPSQDEVQIAFNNYALTIAKAYDLKWIITTDAHYLNIDKQKIHKAYLTSSEEEEGNREIDAFYNSTYFFGIDELYKNLNYIDFEDFVKGVENTKSILDEVTNDYDLFHEQEVPLTPIPNEAEWQIDREIYKDAKEYPFIKQMIESNSIYDRYLINHTLNGLKEKVKTDYKEYYERINIECEQILGISEVKGSPVSGYFTTMEQNIDIIWEDAQSVVMPGRGSAGGYIINYLLGITQIDSLQQGVELPYFRFIHKSKVEYPDIDIDVPSHKRNKVFNEVKKYYNKIGGDVVRVCTFGTETAKSAIQTATRGCKINSDVGLYLSSLIPVERGKVWGLHDCYYGNKDKNRESITEFKNIIDEYVEKDLLNVALGIEGIINKRSSHASGILIVNHDFTDNNAIMRTPSGEVVSQYSLHESEEMGGLKYDFLCTKTSAMIQKTLEMLIEHGKIEYQGTLRETYDKYLHPDILDKTSLILWEKLNNGELISAFQFDSQVGEQALKTIKPTNLLEATSANNLMRLMVEDGKEQPLEMYARYKANPSDWHKDMIDFGLNEKEIKIMEKHLLKDNGVCSTQEGMMLMSMDENISNFDVPQSNKLRKGIAKKLGDVYEEAHKLFYEKGKEIGTRKQLLDYVWDVQIAMQKGYGFSVIHGVEYTYILIQQLNLICKFPSIYWNTAVLLVESGALEQEDTDDEEVDNNKKEKTTQYGKVATAISNIQDAGVNISLPNINTAELGFNPNEKDNEIQFGLKGIMGINKETADLIIQNRPYNSLEDFHKRMVETKREVTLSTGKKQNKSLVTQGQAIILIKAGAFDSVENMPREDVLEKYISICFPLKTNLDTRAIDKIIDMGVIPIELNQYIKYYNFRQYILTLDHRKDDSSNIQWYSLKDENNTDYITNFFIDNFSYDMTENKDYIYNESGYIEIALNTKRKDSFEYVYNKNIKPFLDWLYSDECLRLYNKINFENIKEEKMHGNISSWEMESMNYYYHEHELANVNKEYYEIANFNILPEEPEVIGFTSYKGFNYPKFKLTRIVGTVLDRDKNKHSVSLLTPDGVVTMKMYSGQFAFYDKTISAYNEGNGTKTTLESGWFTRGTKLMITGFRRGQQFKPKKYKGSIYQHTIQKILKVEEDGMLVLQSERRRDE